MRALGAQVRAELRLSFRNGEQLLVSLIIPLMLLVFFSTVEVLPLPDGVHEPVDFLAPGILALAVMSTSLVSLGIATGFERQYGVLKRLGATPLGRPRWVAAKILSVVTIQIVQVVLIVAVALALGWTPGGTPWLTPLALVLGTAAFAGLGLLMAGTLRGTATLALANGLYLVLLLLGGMVFPLDELPRGLEVTASGLPAAALSETVGASLDPARSSGTGPWLVLTAWAALTPLLAAWRFRWE